MLSMTVSHSAEYTIDFKAKLILDIVFHRKYVSILCYIYLLSFHYYYCFCIYIYITFDFQKNISEALIDLNKMTVKKLSKMSNLENKIITVLS